MTDMTLIPWHRDSDGCHPLAGTFCVVARERGGVPVELYTMAREIALRDVLSDASMDPVHAECSALDALAAESLIGRQGDRVQTIALTWTGLIDDEAVRMNFAGLPDAR